MLNNETFGRNRNTIPTLARYLTVRKRDFDSLEEKHRERERRIIPHIKCWYVLCQVNTGRWAADHITVKQ